MDKPKIDFLELAYQALDAHINQELKKVAEESGDEFSAAFLELLNKYGISGVKACEFVNELDKLSKKFGKDL